MLNAKDYGTPQNRERVVIVASKAGWNWPEAIVSEPVAAGIALGNVRAHVPPDAKLLTESMDRYIAEYEKKSHCVTPRDLHLDKPARTLTCRNFGASTSDMQRIKLLDGRRRMLTTREGARLQGFPDWFEFEGNAYQQAEQIGNAVSPLMSLALALQAMKIMESPVTKAPRKISGPVSEHVETPAQEKIRQALKILAEAGLNLRELPPGRRERVAMAMLAVAGIRPSDAWSNARSYLEDNTSEILSQRKILHFWNAHYGTKLADSLYDDVKRKALIHLEAMKLVVAGAKNQSAAINDSTRGHALSLEGLHLIRAYGGQNWQCALDRFKSTVPNLLKEAEDRKKRDVVPVSLPSGSLLEFSPGEHNKLQEAVIRDFLGRFAKDADILYVADAAKKKGDEGALRFHKNEATLERLGLPQFKKGQKHVDIIAYSPSKNWTYLIEAVHSSNPLTPPRHLQIKEWLSDCKAGRVYVTAFATRRDFRKYASDISWDTEVWIAEAPDHLIHFNGDRFLGPHEGDEGV